MNDYSKKIDLQHAPTELIDKTLARIEREGDSEDEQPASHKAGHIYAYVIPTIAAAAVIILITGHMITDRTTYEYNELDMSLVRDMKDVSEDTHSEVIDTDYGHAVLRISYADTPAPAQLLDAKASDVNGAMVYIAADTGNDIPDSEGKDTELRYYAAFDTPDGRHAYIVYNSTATEKKARKDFEQLIVRMLAD